jgi:hypothetical protein
VRNIAESKDDTTFSNYLQFVLNKDVFGDLLPLGEVLLLLPSEEWEKKFYFFGCFDEFGCKHATMNFKSASKQNKTI